MASVGANLQNALAPQYKEIHNKQIQQEKQLQNVEKRLDFHDARHIAAEKRAQQHESSMRELKTSMEEMSRKVHLDSCNALARDGGAPSGGRLPDEYDKTIVRVHAHDLVGAEAVLEEARGLATAAGLEHTDFFFKGQGDAKSFKLEFGGSADTAARRVSKFLAVLKHANGEWKQIAVDRPQGGKERLYFGGDRSDNAAKKQTRTRQVYDLIRLQSDRAYQRNGRDGKVTHAWQVVVVLSADYNIFFV